MGLFLVWRHKLICIVLSLCEHACKEVCDVKQGVDPYPLLARSCGRWWPDFVTFTACKRSIFGFKRGKKAQCISNRCKDLFKRKKYFGDMRTLIEKDFYDLFLRFLLSFSSNWENLKHSGECFTTFWNTSRLVKNTPLRVVPSTLFSMLGNMVKFTQSLTFKLYYVDEQLPNLQFLDDHEWQQFV